MFFIALGFLLVGCNATKRVPKGQYLLTDVKVFDNGKEITDAKVTNFVQQQPNGYLLGVPIGLSLYNLARVNPEGDFDRWMARHPKWKNSLIKILSKKQYGRLRESFFVAGMHNQLKEIGEAPVLLDSSKVKKSDAYLTAYYKSIGYFNASVADSILLNPKNKNNRAEVSYYIEQGDRYYIDSLQTDIASSQIDSVYRLNAKNILLKKGEPYRLDDFTAERNRLNLLFRNTGFYTFQQSSINFEIRRDTLRTNDDTRLDVTTMINNLVERDGDNVTVKPYKIHHLDKINIFADYDFQTDINKLDTLHYKNVIIHYKDKLRYRPKMLQTASALRTGDIYTDDNRSLTYKQINNLRIFKYPNIEYKYSANDSLQQKLDANIYLAALDKFSFKINTDLSRSELQDFGITFGTTFISRNVFRGGEILELNTQGTFGSQQSAADNYKFFNVSEIGGDIRLIFPRILFPFNIDRIIPYSMTPQTTVQFGVNYQTNIGLDRRNLNGIIRYAWNPGKNRSILEIINGQYVRNVNPDNFFNVYTNTYNRLNTIAKNYTLNPDFLDANGNLIINEGITGFLADVTLQNITVSPTDFISILSVLERYSRLIRNDFILSSSYTYIFNRNSQFFERDFSQFRIKLESAGNMLGILSKIGGTTKNSEGKYEIMNVQYAQFIKTELDYIKHWPLGKSSSLAFRSFLGLAIPYGNSENIPFTQSYFAGGSNDNRGWRAYSLGPGKSGSFFDYNEANFKIATNLEYRFPIMGSFKGAIFADAGNIWNVFDDTSFDDFKFKGFSSLKDIGVSTGLGLRYDFGFFVFRLDVGNKTYNPALDPGKRWISGFNAGDFVYNIGINYPF